MACCSVFICEWNQVALTPPPSSLPMILILCRFPGAHTEGMVGGGCVACQSWTLTALLATARPALSLLQPARVGCHGSQVFHTHIMHWHPLRAPPKLQHYPHLLHYYALLSPCCPCCCLPLMSVCSFQTVAGLSDPFLCIWRMYIKIRIIWIFPTATWRKLGSVL